MVIRQLVGGDVCSRLVAKLAAIAIRTAFVTDNFATARELHCLFLCALRTKWAFKAFFNIAPCALHTARA